MTEKRYLGIGSFNEFKNNDGSTKTVISLDNLSLREFVDFVQEHGSKYLKGLSNDEIKAGQKAGDIPRLSIYLFEPNEKAPDFIKHNLAVKLR